VTIILKIEYPQGFYADKIPFCLGRIIRASVEFAKTKKALAAKAIPGKRLSI